MEESRVEGFRGHGLLTPAPLTRLILQSARTATFRLRMAILTLSLLYQLGVRLMKVSFYGDDIAFQLSGIPAVMFTDSSFSAFYPHYHQPGDIPRTSVRTRLSEMTRLILQLFIEHKLKFWRTGRFKSSARIFDAWVDFSKSQRDARLLFCSVLGSYLAFDCSYGKNTYSIAFG